MPTWIKTIWVIATIINLTALVWFLLGSTANFQRSLDLISTVKLLFIWFPVLIFVILSIKLLLTWWVTSNELNYSRLLLIIVIFLVLSVSLFKGVQTSGWLYDSVRSDPLRVTTDGKYEYQFELINLFQKNSRGQLYVKELSTNEEMHILIEIDTNEIYGIRNIKDEDWAWALLTPMETPDHYQLTTTNLLPVPQMKFLVDVKRGIAEQIEKAPN